MTHCCRICVVGSANVDLTFRTVRLPKPGETLAGRGLHTGMGGKGANQAVAAARLGAKVNLVACVGNDSSGADAVDRYRSEGIDTSFVRRINGQATGTAAIIVDDEGENSILIVSGANANLSPADVQHSRAAIQQADAVLCQLETPIETAIAAFRLARSAGKRTMLTPAPVVKLPDELLNLCDLCVPNVTEMEALVGQAVDSQQAAAVAAQSLMARGVKSVALTMGRKGAFIADATQATHVPILEVETVDTTGAGDAFTAALAVSLAKGLSFHAAAQYARLVAAITISRIGTQSAFPTLAELNEKTASEGHA